jgi:hypothetical protein
MTRPTFTISAGLHAAAHVLRVDLVTAEVVSALRRAGVRPILLKGPSIARWLYADGEARAYGDTDLLIEQSARRSAARAMRAAGFRRQLGFVSEQWYRRSDGANVDLHESLFGVGCPPAELWQAVSADTERIEVAGVHVEILSRPARTLYVALHAASHGGDGFETPISDLSRALTSVDDRGWEEAARLAERLHAAEALAVGLRLDPAGATCAARMGLPERAPLVVSLHAHGSPALAQTLEYLATAPGVWPKLRLLRGRIFPPADHMRHRHHLASRGRVGLVLAYPVRIIEVLAKLPRALISWSRLRRGRVTPAESPGTRPPPEI